MELGTLASPTAAAQWARPALPAPAAQSGRRGCGWRTRAPGGGVGAGETIQHMGGGEKPPYRRHGEERNT